MRKRTLVAGFVALVPFAATWQDQAGDRAGDHAVSPGFGPALALAYSAKPSPPVLFPPPGSTVPANAVLRVGVPSDFARVAARRAAAHPDAGAPGATIPLETVVDPAGQLVVRPSVRPSPGTRLEIALEPPRTGRRIFGEGVLGALVWSKDEDRTAPTARLVAVERRDARGPSGRIAGAPDALHLKLEVEESSPFAVLWATAKAGEAPPARRWLALPKRDGALWTVDLAYAGPAAGVRLVLEVVDAADQRSPAIEVPVPPAGDEATAFAVRADAAPPSADPEPAPRPRTGCAR